MKETNLYDGVELVKRYFFIVCKDIVFECIIDFINY